MAHKALSLTPPSHLLPTKETLPVLLQAGFFVESRVAAYWMGKGLPLSEAWPADWLVGSVRGAAIS